MVDITDKDTLSLNSLINIKKPYRIETSIGFFRIIYIKECNYDIKNS